MNTSDFAAELGRIYDVSIAAWSARARPGLGISVPLAWDELKGLDRSDHWNIRNVQTRLDQGNAPWDGYARAAKSLVRVRVRIPGQIPVEQPGQGTLHAHVPGLDDVDMPHDAPRQVVQFERRVPLEEEPA